MFYKMIHRIPLFGFKISIIINIIFFFQHKCYIVATNDKDLKRRIRKIPGVPIMYVAQHRYTIERMPDAYGAPKT